MALHSTAIELTWNEALSGIFGSISLVAWIFVLVPQLVENYRQGSAEGISLLFLSIWFVGDITNLAGATWAQLVPTVIALAVYFCFADLILISQCVYYNVLNKKQDEESRTANGNGEVEPLLSRTDTNESNPSRPGGRRRRSSAQSRRLRAERRESLASIPEESKRGWAWIKSKLRTFSRLNNTVSILLICAIGAAGWAIAWKSGIWKPAPADDPSEGAHMALGAQVLGYVSAVCYLGARIPQIIKNQRDRSCEGLSLLFFLLSLLGNSTYGAGVSWTTPELLAAD